MANTNEYCQKTWRHIQTHILTHFIGDKDIKDSILNQNLVPSDFIAAKKLDEFRTHLLMLVRTLDTTFEKILTKNI